MLESLLPLFIFWIVIDVPYFLYRAIQLFFQPKSPHRVKHSLVTILIPAYNEEVCIEKTLLSCIHQSYKNLEIIVINDGSKDRTREVVDVFEQKYRYYMLKHGIRFSLINRENGGKAKALNSGRVRSTGDFIVTIDADSHLHHNAIERAIHYFQEDDIGAVAGNVVAISENKILGYVQQIEYELGFHFMREPQSSTGSVLVTPGAFSVYRRNALVLFQEGVL